MCPAKDLAGVKTRHPLSGVMGALGGLPPVAVDPLCRSLPAILGREGNTPERAVEPYFVPVLYFKGLFRFFP